MKPTKHLGNAGEQFTAQWLQKQEFSLLSRNFRTRWGEIDIIALKNNLVVFVEVRTRTSLYFPTALTVNKRKQQKLIKTAQIFVVQNNIEEKILRFDIAALLVKNNEFEINYIHNAFHPK